VLPRTLPEQEEAMRETGVNVYTYARIINPRGFIPGRRKNAFEVDLDELELPKWREPGAVMSDFFNYGLNEQTWREYAARQVAVRLYRQQHLKQQHQEVQAAAGQASSAGGAREGDFGDY